MLFWVILWIINLPLFWGIGRMLFDDWEEIFDTIVELLPLVALAWLLGPAGDLALANADASRQWNALKLCFLILLCAASVYAEFKDLAPLLTQS